MRDLFLLHVIFANTIYILYKYKNQIKDKYEDIKSFFTNKEIVDLIIKERYKEFEFFNYSKNINDI